MATRRRERHLKLRISSNLVLVCVFRVLELYVKTRDLKSPHVLCRWRQPSPQRFLRAGPSARRHGLEAPEGPPVQGSVGKSR